MEKLKRIILRAPEYPTAKYITKQGSRRVRVLEENKEELAEILEVGDVIERQLIDGDYVVFNRQPSLHRVSMMGHKVRVLPYKTFRINTTVTTPYNADFDGDEMNLHVPQNEEALSEVSNLMSVSNHIISLRNGRPVLGGKHDHVSGAFLLTRKGVKFNKEELAILLGTSKLRHIMDKLDLTKESFTGKEIFSILLPDDLTITYRNKLCKEDHDCDEVGCDNEGVVKIENGKLLSGVIDAEGMGGILLQKITVKYGKDVAKQFIDLSTRLGASALTYFGFSSSINDSDLPKEVIGEIEKNSQKAINDVYALIEKYNTKKLEVIPGKTAKESLESYVVEILGKARDRSGEIAGQYLGLDNQAVVMARSGARGSMLNLTQICGSVGQQAVRGERISRGFIDRTTSHYKKGELTPEARGFVKSCFKKGLTPTEYFFHAMGGREGLVDTAIRTARSGYLQRRLINALQDIIVKEDFTTRDSGGTIVQFRYGEDGADVSKTYNGEIQLFEEEVLEVERKEQESRDEFSGEVDIIDYEEFETT